MVEESGRNRERHAVAPRRLRAPAGVLERLSRLYSMLSQINRTIIRAQDPYELYTSACRIAVEYGQFSLAWVGLVKPGGRIIVPVAHWGEGAEELEKLPLTVAEPGQDKGATVCAVTEASPCIVNDAIDDPRLAVWHPLLRQLGLRAIASFPLLLENRVIGAFTVVAPEARFFDALETQLLVEMAEDISFALDVLRRDEIRIATESRIRFLAHYDTHTGLPSQSLFEARLEESCHSHAAVAVVVIHLRRYHEILETLGHTAGPAISQGVARTLEILLPAVSVARLTESEFGLMLPLEGSDQVVELDKVAMHIRYALSAGVYVGEREVYPDAFMGIALYPRDGSPAEVLKRAATAAGAGRLGGRSGYYCYFTEEMEAFSQRQLDLDLALRYAIERHEFVLHYQPQCDLKSGRIVGAEALLRWNRPEHGMIAPNEFIPYLESSGLINEVGTWVIQEACRCNKAWQDAGLPPLRIAVNLSARQFAEGDMRETVVAALETTGLEPQWLELELTESIVLQNADATIRALRDLQALGINQALDDFGTGYSSLSYLQRLPVDRIKIDRAFVREITTNPNDAAICRAVVGMARSLGMTVLAEGVETAAQADYLKELGCKEIQGYYFSRPVSENDMGNILREQRRLPVTEVKNDDRMLLLVDDDPAVAEGVRRSLRGQRVEVLSAASVQEGFDMLAQHCCGVVVCDQNMPGMSGTEFLRRVKELHPDVVRIVLTGVTDLNAVIEAINRGAVYKFLTKPWEDQLLLDSLSEAFRLFEIGRENREMSRELEALRKTARF